MAKHEYCLDLVSRDVNPFGEELTTLAVSNQLFGVSYRGWPIETYSESLSD
jgi:hypothetical protein